MSCIGIDLGTTNCSMSIVQSDSISLCPIYQKIAPHLSAEQLLLPSFIYFSDIDDPIVGKYALERSGEVPEQVVSSAKSWLSVEGIDRRNPFLPLNTSSRRISPVQASQMLLSHLKAVFEQAHPQASFGDHEILITVPASFDPSARALVSEAAKKAGLSSITLIEEPLAAFYAWLYDHLNWREILEVGDTILVVDCGGGTTDFSLICAEESNGSLELNRKAVGDHLLLGGDNLDLALAYFLKDRFSTPLDDWQFQMLIHQCRQAKEQLCMKEGPDSVELILLGRGSSLIANTLKTTLSKQECLQFLMEGFFPKLDLKAVEIASSRSALTEGLPYAKEPRITAQLASFFTKTGLSLPSKVLFNGGTMKGELFRQRILDCLSSWRGEKVVELTGADLDFGVSRGAAYYGKIRKEGALRVKAGVARSFYVGVESVGPAVPGIVTPLHAICLVPQGTEEGSEIELNEKSFFLVANEPVVFRFFSTTTSNSQEEIPSLGSMLKSVKSLKELHPIETTIKHTDSNEKMLEVTLKGRISEMGLFELFCYAKDGRHWQLEFDLRD